MRRVSIVLSILIVAGLFAPIAVASGYEADGDERADLEISQPTYVDASVERETTENRTIYHLEGPEHEIRLGSINHSDITAAGVADGSGSLEYDEDVDAWRFDAEGEAGTRVVYFETIETVESEREVQDGDGNTTTETYETDETVRHVATLSVDEVEWAHRPADRDDQLERDAANWSAVESQAARINPDQPPAETIEDAFRDHEFLTNPFASFLDDARGTILMATRPGGLAIYGTVLGLSAVILGFTIVRLHRRERQLEEVGDVDEARDEAYLEMARKLLPENDWNDFLPEHLARHCRNYLGRNCYLGYKRYLLLRSPSHTKGLLLQLMGQVGYVGRAVLEDGEIVEARVLHSSEIDDDVATDGGAEPIEVDLTKLDADVDRDRRFVDLVRGEDLDVDILWRPDDLDLDAVEWPIDERNTEDSRILEAINPDFPHDFEDEEQLTEVLSGLINLVANHEFTTEDGRPRRERDFLSFLGELDGVLADEVDFPLAPVQRRMLILAAERMDKGEELHEEVKRYEDEGLDLGGDLDVDLDRDDDPSGGAAISFDDGSDDDPGGESETVDEDVEESLELELYVEDDDVDDEEGSDNSPLSGSDSTAPLEDLAIAAGYSLDESGLEELAADAGVSWDMDDEEIASRILVHCRREIPSDEFIEILDKGGDE